MTTATRSRWNLPAAGLQALIDALRDDGRTVIGPVVRDGAIVLDEIRHADQLPRGIRDTQAPGRYGLQQTDSTRRFDFASTATSWKRYLYPPQLPVTESDSGPGGTTVRLVVEPAPRLAFLGVRGCDLAALGILDRVLAQGPVVDEDYVRRRPTALIVAVQCVAPAATCFCASMGTGPAVESGYDLALTELDGTFLVETGSPAGEALVERLRLEPAADADVVDAVDRLDAARRSMTDGVDVVGLPERLRERLDDPGWARVAERCLSCANCTLACPTCFCTSFVPSVDLDGKVAQTTRTWDSCFDVGFASVAGGNFRSRPEDRYRQWLTHKFSSWVDQFGSMGCVGCGRCVTWCPAAIDIRDELRAIAPAPRRALPVIPAAASTPGQPVRAMTTVRSNTAETADTRTLQLVDVPQRILGGDPGSFVMVELPGHPPLPISVSRYASDHLELTVRGAGAATRAITALRPGDQLPIRGPMGRGWPVTAARAQDVVIVAGGIGLAPLRPVIDAIAADRASFGAVRLFIGTRTPADALYRAELEQLLDRGIEVATTVDRAGPEWLGRVGVVTTLFDRAAWDGARTVAFVCGPERMMDASARVLAARGVPEERIFVSLERHMECGVGLCGHCQLGPLFVCRDGPVFSRAELGDRMTVEGL